MRRRPWIAFVVALVVCALGVGGLALWHHHRVKREAAARDESTPRGYERRRLLVGRFLDISRNARLTHPTSPDSLAAS